MRSTAISIAAVLAIAACSKESSSTDAPSAPRATPTVSESRLDHHPVDVKWGPAPAVLPPGAEIAVLQGDPGSTEPFTIRLRFPNGYKIPPHTHPTTENITVLQGTFLAGNGPEFKEPTLQAFARDDFLSIPAEHPHFAKARGETVIQLHAVGPFVITYVNPADNPMAR